MTAPKPLPRCPVCGRNPLPGTFRMGDGIPPLYLRRCQRSGWSTFHEVETRGNTQREADSRWRSHVARWRRLAAAREGKP